MGNLHIILAYHGVLHRCIDLRMAQELLHLLDWHTLIYGTGSQCSAEFMRMNVVEA